MRLRDRAKRAFQLLVFRRDVDREIREEIDFYLAMRAAEFEASGLEPEQARQAALEAFGDPTRVRSHTLQVAERTRRRRGWIEAAADAGRDFLQALRSLRRRPGYAATVVVTLALGIGANTAIFTVVNSVLLRPLPFSEPDRLVRLFETTPRTQNRSSSPLSYLDAREQIESFEHLTALRTLPRNLLGEGEPERLVVGNVSANFFETLGVRASVGRVFTTEPAFPGEAREAVLSHDLWVRRFGSDPSLVGRSIRLDGETLMVAGVMPELFRIPEQASLWIKAYRDVPEPGMRFDGDHSAMRDAWYFQAIGRLATGASMARAQSELDGLAASIREADPESNRDMGFRLVPLLEETVDSARTMLLLLMGAVSFVLLIACVNVASLALARAASRQRELGVRAALGAGRGRLVRHLLGESAVLGIAGGAAGVTMAAVGVRVLVAVAPGGLPRVGEIGLDRAALVFALVATLVTILAFGLFPALSAARPGALSSLGGRTGTGGSSRSGDRPRAALVVIETALALVLVLGATLSAKSLWRLSRVDLGFSTERLVTLPFTLPGAVDMESVEWLRVYGDVLDRVQAVPGVVAAGLATRGPVSTGLQAGLRVEGRELNFNDPPNVGWQTVSPEYFSSVGIPIIEGRGFDGTDRPESPAVAVINETMARSIFPDEDPIGQRINTGLDDGIGNWVTVVGIAGDTRNRGPGQPVLPAYFRPLGQPGAFSGEGMMITVRTSGDPASMVPIVQQAAWAARDDLPFYRVMAGDENAAGFSAGARFLVVLLGSFAVVALTLGAVGIYGVVAFAAARRTAEIGVRVALGASRKEVVGLVLRQGLRLAGLGIGAGLVAAVALSRFLEALLFDVSTTDWQSYGAVALVLIAVSVAASLVPAIRASGIDPVRAITSDG